MGLTRRYLFKGYKTTFRMQQVPKRFSSIEADVMLTYDALSTLLHGTQQVLSTKNTNSSSDLTEAQKPGAYAVQDIT